MKIKNFKMYLESIKSKISWVLVVSMLLPSCVTFVSDDTYAKPLPKLIEETETDENYIETDMFYVGSQQLEVTENTGDSYLLKVKRTGECKTAEKVRLTMNDMNAKIGKDYNVRVYGDTFFSDKVKNKYKAKSIYEYMKSSKYTEYNYSDAIVDGTINSENQMTDEEIANYEYTDEDKKKIENDTNEFLNQIGFGEEKGNNIEENVIIDDEEEESENLALILASGSDVEKVTFETASDSDMSLDTAWEKFTGLKNDKKKRTIVNREMNIPIISDLDAKSEGYMQDGIEEVSKELNSAYIDLTFKEGQVEKLIEIEIIDDKKYKGSRQSGFTLSSIDGSVVSGMYSSFTLMINDDEEMVLDDISFEKKSYNAKEGYIEVKVKKTGSYVGMSTCMIDTENISAVRGRDYSEVHAKLIFGMGVDERVIKIPIRTEFVDNSDLTFKLKLQKPENAKIGSTAETICHIKKSDISFTKFRTDGNEFFGAQFNTDNNEFLGAQDIQIGDYIVDEPIKLKNTIYYTKSSGNSNSHMGVVGDHGYKIYLEDKTFFCKPSYYVWSKFDTTLERDKYSHPHYDYCGVRIYASKDAENGHIHLSINDLNKKRWVEVFNENRLIWNRTTKDAIFPFDTKCIDAIDFELGKYHGCWRQNPTMEIFELRPIKTMYKVGMIDPDCPTLINDAGNLVPSKQIGAYQTMHETIFEGATNERKEIAAYSGKEIEVSLRNNNNNIFYIKGLDLVHPTDQTRSIRVYTNDSDESKTTVSFKFDNEFIRTHNDYINYYKNNQNRREGSFKIKPIIGTKKAEISVKKDSRADVVLYDSNDSYGRERVKQGYNRNEFTVYNYNVGDVVRYRVNMHASHANDYTCDSLQMRVTKPLSRDTISIHKRDNTDVFYNTLKNSAIEITPLISVKKQKIVVRVKKSDISFFNQNQGIFRSNKNDVGDYYEYEVVSGVPTFNREYEFNAFTIDSSYTPVWSEVGRTDIKYTQSKYYFRGANIDASNILYLTAEKADDIKYSVTGTIYYLERVIGSGQTESYKWQVARGVPLTIDDTHFGMTDEKGQFSTMPIGGKNNYYVKIKYLNNGLPKYITTKLNQDKKVTRRYKYDFEGGGGSSGESYDFTVTSYDVIENNITISDNDTSRVYIRAVDCKNFSGNQGKIVWIDNRLSTLTAYVQTKDPKTGEEYTYEYKDVDGNIHVEKEHPKRVEFVVLDKFTRKEKFVIKATISNADNTSFTGIWGFEKGQYDKYDNGDYLYVRLVTDRKVGDGTGIDKDGIRRPLAIFQETTYAALNTGVVFQEEGEKIQEPINIELMAEGIYQLPLIGDMKTMINALGMSFGMQNDTATGRIRLFFGKRIMNKGSRFDGNGNPTGDNGVYYDLSNFTEGFSDMKDFIKSMGNKFLNTMAIGIPTWTFEPMAGVYFEFVPSYVIKEGQTIVQIVFAGAGGYIGCITNFRYTFYFLIMGLPCYIGGDVNLVLNAEFGLAANAGEKQVLNDPTQEFFNNLISKNHFEFVFRSQIQASAYAGVGLCGVLGVRGGFQLTLNFIVSPMAKKQIGPKFRTTGFSTTGQIKFWADAVLLTVPIPVYTLFNYNQGYFKDLENYKKEKDEEKRKRMFTTTMGFGEEEYLGIEDDEDTLGELGIKPVYDIPSTFVGNNNNKIFKSTYEKLSDKNIVLNSYDASEPKLMEIDNDKILMVYIDQDLSRQDVDRTVLKYSVYHVDNDTWDSPKLLPSQSNESADFTPYLCDCGDRIFITWSSRPSKIADKNDIKSYLQNMEIYGAFYNKSNGQIEEFERLTDDNYFDYYPKAIYDPDIGNVVVSYLKASVSEINNSSDFLNNIQTDVNGALTCYMYYDVTEHTHGDLIPGGWMRDDYWPEEVPGTMPEAERKALCAALKGQRFIASPIKDKYGNVITNPVISDYDVCYTKIMNISEENILEIKNKLGITEATMSEIQEENLRNELAPYYKTLGVYTFVADLDGQVSTKDDTEIYIQFFEDKGGMSNPIRVTNNSFSDTLPKTVATSIDSTISKDKYEVALMWIQDNSTLKYLSLQNIIYSNNNTELDYGTINIPTTDEIMLGNSLENFYPFVDNDGQLYIVWTENGKEMIEMNEKNYNKPLEFAQDLFVVGRIKEDSSLVDSKSFWSKPVRLTNNKKMNTMPSGVVLQDDKLLLVNNQYHFYGLDSGSQLDDGMSKQNQGKYKIEESNLVETIYKNVSSVEIDSISASFDTEENGKKRYNVNIKLVNNGLRTAHGFSYNGKIYCGGQTLVTLNGNDEKNLVPANYTSIACSIDLTDDMLKNIENIKVDLNIKENGIGDPGINCNGKNVFDIEKKFEFQRIDQANKLNTNEDLLIVEQYEDKFVISGNLINKGNINAKGNERIYVSKNGDLNNPIYIGETFSLEQSEVMPFEITIPAEKLDLDEYGFQDLILYVADDKQKYSNYEVVTAYVNDAYNIKINGKAIDKIEISKGDKLNLDVTYSPKEIYKNATIIYSVEDTNIAKMNENVIEGVKVGTTILHLTTEEFGGNKEIIVSVIEKNNGRRNNQQSSYDNYGGGGGGGIPYINNLIAMQQFNGRPMGIPNSWLYDQISNKWYRIGKDGQAILGWYKEVNGPWYYLGYSYAMQEGYTLVDGKWYYFAKSDNELPGKIRGQLFTNCYTPNGWYAGPDGNISELDTIYAIKSAELKN